MPALVAVVRREAKRVYLDPAVMAGDRIQTQPGDEVHVLRISTSGHCGEHAKAVAGRMRASGWRVTIRDCGDLEPRSIDAPARTIEQIRAVGRQLAEQLADVDNLLPVEPTPAVVRTELIPDGYRMAADGRLKRSTRNTHKKRCSMCGRVSFAGAIGIHQKASGHTGWEWLDTEGAAEVPPLVNAGA